MGQADTVFRLRGAGPSALPSQVLALKPRMREVATIVYLNGQATARNVEQSIARPLSGNGIRTLLNRLADRGILTRRRSGAHKEIVYLPAILTDEVREIALKRFIEQNCENSLSIALQSTLRLISPEQGRPHP